MPPVGEPLKPERVQPPRAKLQIDELVEMLCQEVKAEYALPERRAHTLESHLRQIESLKNNLDREAKANAMEASAQAAPREKPHKRERPPEEDEMADIEGDATPVATERSEDAVAATLHAAAERMRVGPAAVARASHRDDPRSPAGPQAGYRRRGGVRDRPARHGALRRAGAQLSSTALGGRRTLGPA